MAPKSDAVGKTYPPTSYAVGREKVREFAAAVKDEASHFSNIKVLSTDAKGDVAKLTSDVEDLLNQNVNVFIISGAWIEAAPAALEAINQAGVPIVMVDRQLKGGEFNAWVGPDNRAIGEGIGEHDLVA